ncbi:iron transporter [Haloechinothrix sp. YIM 98757]|uniref:Iron transporter n=1 Tax=Haloechinothrix aidingensis TaxID=2752311 RepID=A0A838A7M1_9PSEU|nr:iron transporter [Haloechinothrix aidingensis]
MPKGVAKQYAHLAEEIADEGGQTESGPWRIGYIVEPAEGWYASEGDDTRFREPAGDETHHIEVVPFEADSGRVVPDVPIRVEILDGDGQVVDANDLDFFYGEAFHYGNNFAVPEQGEYTLRVTLEPPRFLRHGEQDEDPALTEGAEVEFTDVQLESSG